METSILSLITFLPFVGALLVALCVRSCDTKCTSLARSIAVIASLVTLALSIGVLCRFDLANTGFQLVEKHLWIPAFDMYYIKGVDGVSVWFVLITALLTPISLLASMSQAKRVKEFMIALLVLEGMLIGVFTALDFVQFYIFFEGTLIPAFLLIGIWGGEKRTAAAYKLFIYTFFGSVLMLLAVFAMVFLAGTSDMTQMMGGKFPKEMVTWLWLGFFVSFAVKTPMWPFHTWQPDAYAEAPTGANILLAGVMAKMGCYGFIRIALQMLPDASAHFAPMVMALSVIGIVYASLVALAQTDMKRLLAYSSIAHMGFVTLGIFSLNQQGLDGALFVMLSHSLVAPALFFCAGVVWDRMGSTEIKRFGGMATNMPRYALIFMVFMLASIGLPGLSGFVGEILCLQGSYLAGSGYAFVAASGMFLGAAYMLWLYRRLFYGPLESGAVRGMPDLGGREIVLFVPLVVGVLWLGLHATTFGSVFGPTTNQILTDYHKQIEGEHRE